MSFINLLPNKSYVLTRGANQIHNVKCYRLSVENWVKYGAMYVYKIKDTNVTYDSIVLLTSMKEYYQDIKRFELMLQFPDVERNTISIYSSNQPTIELVINYTVINNEPGVLNDKADDITYKDTNNIGLTNLQKVIDKIISIIKPTTVTATITSNSWVTDGSEIYSDFTLPSGYTVTDNVGIDYNDGCNIQLVRQYYGADIFYISKTGENSIRIYGKGTKPTMNIPVDIRL